MEYVFFKKAVGAYRAFIEKGSGNRIDRQTFVERWGNIQRMQGIKCPR